MTPKDLRTIRLMLDADVAGFAQLLQTDSGTVQKWENGESTPSPDQVRSAVEILAARGLRWPLATATG